jgi:hypothetical protein
MNDVAIAEAEILVNCLAITVYIEYHKQPTIDYAWLFREILNRNLAIAEFQVTEMNPFSQIQNPSGTMSLFGSRDDVDQLSDDLCEEGWEIVITGVKLIK